MLVSSIARLSAVKSSGRFNNNMTINSANTFNGDNQLFSNNGLLKHKSLTNFINKSSNINYFA